MAKILREIILFFLKPLQLNLVIGLFCLCFGVFIGHRIAQVRVMELEQQLDSIVNAAKTAKEQFDKDKATLTAQTKMFEEEGRKAMQDSQKAINEYKAIVTRGLAKKDQELSDLRAGIVSREASLRILESDLAKAKSDGERAIIEARISMEEKRLAEARLREAGLNCLMVPIPQEYIDAINGI